jgi:isochorismate synthase
MSLDAPDLAAIERATAAARSTGQTQWVAYVAVVDSIDALECFGRCGEDDRYLWERRDANEAHVAWGRVDEIESAGSERFRDVEAWVHGVGVRLHWIGADRPKSAPVFVGGFAFEEDGTSAAKWKAFPSARFVLPAALGDSCPDGTRFTVLARVEPGATEDEIRAELTKRLGQARAIARGPGFESPRQVPPDLNIKNVGNWPPGPEYRVRSDRPHDIFEGQVGLALEAIEGGGLEKVVLARSLRVDHDGRLDLPGFLARLRELYPSCTLVAMGRGADTFLAATPETLICVDGDRIETAALAGSAPRGRTPDEDERLATRLRSSPKERAEHSHVVDAMRGVLAPRCEELEIADVPSLRALFGIQHLETKISGRLRPKSERVGSTRPPNDLLELVSALHPTPAVGGAPREAAREWLRHAEGLDRGWYASPVGWLDAAGGGEFCVALRSALVHSGASAVPEERSSRAWLFAGAGIVSGSQPKEELAETRVKLRALLAPLTEI